MDEGEKQYLEDLKRTHNQRLRILEFKAAQYGINTPPEIIMEIDDIKAKIDVLCRTLENSTATISDNDEKVRSDSQIEIVNISPKELAARYSRVSSIREKKMKFEDMYYGKYVKWKGQVTTCRIIDDSLYICCPYMHTFIYDLKRITYTKGSSLEEGSIVIIFGKISSISDDYSETEVDIDDCLLEVIGHVEDMGQPKSATLWLEDFIERIKDKFSQFSAL